MKNQKNKNHSKNINFNTIASFTSLIISLSVLVSFLILNAYIETMQQELNTLKIENAEIHTELCNTDMKLQEMILKKTIGWKKC